MIKSKKKGLMCFLSYLFEGAMTLKGAYLEKKKSLGDPTLHISRSTMFQICSRNSEVLNEGDKIDFFYRKFYIYTIFLGLLLTLKLQPATTKT